MANLKSTPSTPEFLSLLSTMRQLRSQGRGSYSLNDLRRQCAKDGTGPADSRSPLLGGKARGTGSVIKGDSEDAVELHFNQQVAAHGGQAYKFVSPGCAGVPDRIAIFPFNRVYFVELKKKTGRIRSLQWLWSVKVLDVGVNVEFLKSKVEVDAWIRRVV